MTMFKTKTRVVHVKTEKLYEILSTPDKCFIENGAVPAYAYTSLEEGINPRIWVRPQSEMEDGRFQAQDEWVKARSSGLAW